MTVRKHEYTNQDGTPFGRKEKEADKQYKWYKYDGDDCVYGLNGIKAPIYRLHKVAEAKRLWLVEGEHDVDTLEEFGLIATCGPNGCSWDDEWATWFEGKEVYICGDNDPQGRKYVEKAAKSLSGMGAAVKIIRVPLDYKDLTDYKDATGGEFTALLERLRLNAEPFADLHAGPNGDSQNNDSIIKKLEDCRFDLNNLHEKPDARITLDGKCLSTAGNLMVIQAKPKAGKTACVGAILSACMSDDKDEDYLGFKTSDNTHGHAVIHFDSEQSPYDFEQVILRAQRRANVGIPPWIQSFRTVGWTAGERRLALELSLQYAHLNYGGVFVTLIDGVADLVEDTNESIKCNAYVDVLHGLAVKYDCVIVTVIHENPGDNNANKARGHLGSQLERKAECSIKIDKDGKTEVIEVFTHVGRNCFISQSAAVTIKWDDKAQMIVRCDKAKAGRPKDDARPTIREIFDCDIAREQCHGLTFTQIADRIVDLKIQKTTKNADRRIAGYVAEGYIEKPETGKLYFITDAQ